MGVFGVLGVLGVFGVLGVLGVLAVLGVFGVFGVSEVLTVTLESLAVADGSALAEGELVADGLAEVLPGVASAVTDGVGLGVTVSAVARVAPPSTLMPTAPVTAQRAVDREIFMVCPFSVIDWFEFTRRW